MLAGGKTIALAIIGILAAVAASGGQNPLAEDVVAQGPIVDRVYRILKTHNLKPEDAPKASELFQKSSLVLLNVRGVRTNVPVELSVFRHEGTATQGEKAWPLAFHEMQIRSIGNEEFTWSCWTSDAPIPHRFQILTTETSNSYACLIQGGVHLFLLKESRDSSVMRRRYLEVATPDGRHPDALPSLLVGQLKETLGRENVFGLGPQMFNVTVDKLSDSAGELQVTVHGATPMPQCTFALRKGQWELVSTKIE